jgi:uncharacterized membrane protein
VFLVVLATWIFGIGALAILRYHTFRTNAFDLGIFNQAFTTALQGKLFYETPDLQVIPSGSFLGTHFNLLMFILLPLYVLVPRPETLLAIQTIFLGLGAVPVWLISDRLLRNRRLSLGVSAAYLLNPAILSLSLYDFHLEAFLPFLLGMLFYSFLEKHWRRYFLFLGLAFVSFEFAAVLVGAISLSHLIQRMRLQPRSQDRAWVPLSFGLERTELVVLLTTILLAPLVLFITLTASSYFSGTSANAASITSGFLNLGGYSDPHLELRVQFWLILFGVLLFLPVLAPRNLVMVLPWFAMTLLPGPIPWFLIGYQYGGAFAAPFLIWCAILGLRRISPALAVKRALPIVLIASFFLSPINPIMQGNLGGIAYEQGLPIPTAHDQILWRAVQLVPHGASILAQNNLFPPVSDRSNAYVYLPTNQTRVEFVFADISSRWYTAKIWNNQSMSRWLPYFLSTGRYGILVNDDGVVLIQEGYSGPRILSSQQKGGLPDRDFVRTADSLGAYAESVHEFAMKSLAERDFRVVKIAARFLCVDPFLFECRRPT